MSSPADSSVIGLVPAAGLARRLAPLPGSKELLPLWPSTAGGQPRAVCEHVLTKMQDAGIGRAFVLLRQGKWDIPAYLAAREPSALAIAYLVATLPYGVPFTLDTAYPFVKTQRVALGFPDILFDADDAFGQVLAKQNQSGCDVMLGLFPADQPHTMDMIEIEGSRVRRILIKPAATTLRLSWAIATWNPAFTCFMHEHLAELMRRGKTQNEVHVGDVLQAAIEAGLCVEGTSVSTTPYLDIGNPDGLRRAYGRLAAP